jgi:uncharacterized membrane protein
MPKKDVKLGKEIKEDVIDITEKGGVVQSGLAKVGEKVEKLGGGVVKNITKPLFQDHKKLTFGQRMADWIAKWAGSWTFIILFFIFLVAWMALNAYFWFKYVNGNPFDPFPFILLNLVLSCLAAIQAPVILMSQNRAAQRDRLRVEYDYQINRKSEREIREIKEQLNRIEEKLRIKLRKKVYK